VPGSNSCPLLWRVLPDSAREKYHSPQIVSSSIFKVMLVRLSMEVLLKLGRTCLFVADI